MTRYLALAFTTLCCACASSTTTGTMDTSTAPTMPTLSTETVDLLEDGEKKTTVPKVTEDRKDGPIDTLARTLHVYWFFGSR